MRGPGNNSARPAARRSLCELEAGRPPRLSLLPRIPQSTALSIAPAHQPIAPAAPHVAPAARPIAPAVWHIAPAARHAVPAAPPDQADFPAGRALFAGGSPALASAASAIATMRRARRPLAGPCCMAGGRTRVYASAAPWPSWPEPSRAPAWFASGARLRPSSNQARRRRVSPPAPAVTVRPRVSHRSRAEAGLVPPAGAPESAAAGALESAPASRRQAARPARQAGSPWGPPVSYLSVFFTLTGANG